LTVLLFEAVTDNRWQHPEYHAHSAEFRKDACHNLSVNYESSVTGKELFPCPKCCKVYHWKKSLLLHMRYECGKEPQFRCPYCPHRAKLRGNLLRHVKRKHFTDKDAGQ